MDAADIDPEMAAFMGFASFGTQPAAKKRKYNHRTDAVAASDSATGANQVALATRTPSSAAAAASATNADEIALDSDAEIDTTTAAVADTKADDPYPAAAADNNNDDDEEGGASLYSDPTVAPALAHAQSLIDELTVRGGVGSAASQAQQGGAGAGDALPSGASLPRRPEASWGREMGAAPTSMPGWNQGDAPHGGRGGRGGARNNHHHHQQRDDGKPWWEGYYDHKSNENPWAKLEKAAGVESRGSWALEGHPQTA
ncbi:hypothetical protein K4K49_007441 [Colletotrichum sp. SAR 10_70]|nr:hypothetical protein K4K50_012726 [Colletotrichum sp. SAR 10_71]KAI8159811.1 hypothetical protein K4K49_007441 [Colletotrichum sp. SAR 10_70]KAI8209447.1 hypothetical protein K4K53_012778 [Colletotrichum sp. SAR 10_77]KAJ4997661.1 hypothetical protein K4K48_006684 [Colletotrichum sp. SAR 10_66]